MRQVLLKRDRYVGSPLPVSKISVSTNQGDCPQDGRLRIHCSVPKRPATFFLRGK
jgi:hypothetical protein